MGSRARGSRTFKAINRRVKQSLKATLTARPALNETRAQDWQRLNNAKFCKSSAGGICSRRKWGIVEASLDGGGAEHCRMMTPSNPMGCMSR